MPFSWPKYRCWLHIYRLSACHSDSCTWYMGFRAIPFPWRILLASLWKNQVVILCSPAAYVLLTLVYNKASHFLLGVSHGCILFKFGFISRPSSFRHILQKSLRKAARVFTLLRVATGCLCRHRFWSLSSFVLLVHWVGDPRTLGLFSKIDLYNFYNVVEWFFSC